jgi:hypothetical protein
VPRLLYRPKSTSRVVVRGVVAVGARFTVCQGLDPVLPLDLGADILDGLGRSLLQDDSDLAHVHDYIIDPAVYRLICKDGTAC